MKIEPCEDMAGPNVLSVFPEDTFLFWKCYTYNLFSTTKITYFRISSCHWHWIIFLTSPSNYLAFSGFTRDSNTLYYSQTTCILCTLDGWSILKGGSWRDCKMFYLLPHLNLYAQYFKFNSHIITKCVTISPTPPPHSIPARHVIFSRLSLPIQNILLPPLLTFQNAAAIMRFYP